MTIQVSHISGASGGGAYPKQQSAYPTQQPAYPTQQQGSYPAQPQAPYPGQYQAQPGPPPPYQGRC